jgi:hypothetical protein
MLHHIVHAAFDVALAVLLFGMVLGAALTLIVGHVVRRIRKR